MSTNIEALLSKKYPSLSRLRSKLALDHLISKEVIELPRWIAEEAERHIKVIYKLAHHPNYKVNISSPDSAISQSSVPNASVLMGYDYHIDFENKRLGLIEINTNSSGYPLIEPLYSQSSDLETPLLTELHRSFSQELRFARGTGVAIIDEDLQQQKMFAEFFMYKDLFEHWGWQTEIIEQKDLNWSAETQQLTSPQLADIHFVYNRYCDFYLNKTQSANLRQAFMSEKVILSPNPKEYALLADKARMMEWSNEALHEACDLDSDEKGILQQHLLKTQYASHFDSFETIWSQRKSLFFKPARSHGGKATFRGKSISRTAFDNIVQPDTIVQEFIPAPSHIDEQDGTKWRYDLRFFVYKDTIQMTCARIYQGQVTNFKTSGGGFARVEWV